MIWGECIITIDTENFMNKVHEVMNSLVKYLIRGECNIIIDTDTSINKENGEMNYPVMDMIKGESDITIDTETFLAYNERYIFSCSSPKNSAKMKGHPSIQNFLTLQSKG